MKFPIILAALLLTGCTGSATKIAFDKIPPELADCTTYRLTEGGGMGSVIVMRCPNSTTSTQHSDPNPELGSRTNVVVDTTKK